MVNKRIMTAASIVLSLSVAACVYYSISFSIAHYNDSIEISNLDGEIRNYYSVHIDTDEPVMLYLPFPLNENDTPYEESFRNITIEGNGSVSLDDTQNGFALKIQANSSLYVSSTTIFKSDINHLANPVKTLSLSYIDPDYVLWFWIYSNSSSATIRFTFSSQNQYSFSNSNNQEIICYNFPNGISMTEIVNSTWQLVSPNYEGQQIPFISGYCLGDTIYGPIDSDFQFTFTITLALLIFICVMGFMIPRFHWIRMLNVLILELSVVVILLIGILCYRNELLGYYPYSPPTTRFHYMYTNILPFLTIPILLLVLLTLLLMFKMIKNKNYWYRIYYLSENRQVQLFKNLKAMATKHHHAMIAFCSLYPFSYSIVMNFYNDTALFLCSKFPFLRKKIKMIVYLQNTNVKGFLEILDQYA